MATKEDQTEYYDDAYFDSEVDSDQELNESPGIGLLDKNKKQPVIKHKNRKIISNDELFYDPDIDDKDEEWVLKQIKANSKKQDQDISIDSKTDAILTCPMCFTTLCFSCQRHEKYANQFRAMFVRNCDTVKGEIYKPKGSKEEYLKVLCQTCNIQVAMLDKDEVYHFFNVVATSH